jgi:hypothetical protein
MAFKLLSGSPKSVNTKTEPDVPSSKQEVGADIPSSAAKQIGWNFWSRVNFPPTESLKNIDRYVAELHREKSWLEKERVKIQQQKLQTANEVNEIDREIEELAKKKKILEESLSKLSARDLEIKAKGTFFYCLDLM